MFNRNKFKLELELKDFTPEEVIAGFKEARTISIEKLMLELLHSKNLSSPIFDFGNFSIQDRQAIEKWGKTYFRDVFVLDAKEAEPFVTKLSAREIAVLGTIYYSTGCIGKAFHYLKLAADQDDELAQFYLDVCYQYQGNFREAQPLYENGVVKNYIPSIYALGHLLKEEDPKLALKYIKDAAEKGNVLALSQLGNLYLLGGLGLRKDKNLAKKINAAAAIKGNVASLNNYCVDLPRDQTWKFIRLASSYDVVISETYKTLRERFLEDFTESLLPSPALIYHAALGLKDTATPKDLSKLKAAFSKLFKKRPEEVERLSKELNDDPQEILNFLNDTTQKFHADRNSKIQNQLTLFLGTQGLTPPLAKIVGDYALIFKTNTISETKPEPIQESRCVVQ